MSAVVPLWPVFMANIGYSKTAIGGLWALAALGEAPCMILAGQLPIAGAQAGDADRVRRV